jgi:CDP-diglyceride synthetase
MADHSSGNASNDMESHKTTYEGFLTGAVGLSIICLFVVIALVDFRFAASHNVLLGFGGIIVGTIAVLIDARTGARWFLSAALLVLFGLLSAFSVS